MDNYLYGAFKVIIPDEGIFNYQSKAGLRLYLLIFQASQ